MGKNHAVKEMVGEEKVKPKFVQFVCLRGWRLGAFDYFDRFSDAGGD
jgi:hypothetical protein